LPFPGTLPQEFPGWMLSSRNSPGELLPMVVISPETCAELLAPAFLELSPKFRGLGDERRKLVLRRESVCTRPGLLGALSHVKAVPVEVNKVTVVDGEYNLYLVPGYGNLSEFAQVAGSVLQWRFVPTECKFGETVPVIDSKTLSRISYKLKGDVAAYMDHKGIDWKYVALTAGEGDSSLIFHQGNSFFAYAPRPGWVWFGTVPAGAPRTFGAIRSCRNSMRTFIYADEEGDVFNQAEYSSLAGLSPIAIHNMEDDVPELVALDPLPGDSDDDDNDGGAFWTEDGVTYPVHDWTGEGDEDLMD